MNKYSITYRLLRRNNIKEKISQYLKQIIFFFIAIIPITVLGQKQVKLSRYLGKKIKTVLECQIISSDSIRHNDGIDSLIYNKEKIQWETLLQLDENNFLIKKRVLKRVQIALPNNSKWFYDSDKPTQLSKLLAFFNKVSDKLVNKTIITSINIDSIARVNPPFFYSSPFDTADYMSSLFYFQSIPLKNEGNNCWVDSIVNDRYKIIDTFCTKSMVESEFTFTFKSTIISNMDWMKQEYQNDNSPIINFSENSIEIKGSMTIDFNTHFISSMKGVIVKTIRSNTIDGEIQHPDFLSEFHLYNAIE